MGRPSKLSDAQWAEIGRRLANGEGVSDLAREYGVGKARVSERFSKRTGTIKALARKVADTELELETLSVPEQGVVRSLADNMKRTTVNMGVAAEASSATMARLSELAAKRLPNLENDLGAIDREKLAEVMALTAASNKAAEIPMTLLGMMKNGGTLPGDDSADDPAKHQTGARTKAQMIVDAVREIGETTGRA